MPTLKELKAICKAQNIKGYSTKNKKELELLISSSNIEQEPEQPKQEEPEQPKQEEPEQPKQEEEDNTDKEEEDNTDQEEPEQPKQEEEEEEIKIHTVKCYKTPYGDKEKKTFNLPFTPYKKAIELIDKNENKRLHLRLNNNKKCLVFGDLDHIKDEEEYKKILNLLCDVFKVSFNDISLTKSYNTDNEISSHFTIPKYKTDFKTLKELFDKKQFTDFNKGSKKIFDTSIYSSSKWFRLPNQTGDGKNNIHKIINGKSEDFLIHHNTNDKIEFIPSSEIAPNTEILIHHNTNDKIEFIPNTEIAPNKEIALEIINL